MAKGPLQFAGGLVIEIGSVLLGLALLPALPWQQWKTMIEQPSAPSSLSLLESTASAESRYAVQNDGQSKLLEPRSYTQPWSGHARVVAPQIASRPNIENVQAPPSDFQQQYVSEGADRGTQGLLVPYTDSNRVIEQADIRPSLVPSQSYYQRPQLPPGALPAAPRYTQPQTAQLVPAPASRQLVDRTRMPLVEERGATLQLPAPPQSYEAPRSRFAEVQVQRQQPVTLSRPSLPAASYTAPSYTAPQTVAPTYVAPQYTSAPNYPRTAYAAPAPAPIAPQLASPTPSREQYVPRYTRPQSTASASVPTYNAPAAYRSTLPRPTLQY